MKIVHIVHPHQLKKEKLKPAVMALGFFDGVHLGHQKVINTAKEKAVELGFQSAVMTFDPHPSVVLAKENKQTKCITPVHQKAKYIEELGIDILYIVKFDEAFANLEPQTFVDQYIIGLRVKHVVAGFDYSYGVFGKGTMETLPSHAHGQFTQTTVGKLTCDEEKISSTRIRRLIASGKVNEIPEILGRAYTIEGIVVHGDKRGRMIGFPTANIQVDEEYLLPPVGVYGVRLKINNMWHDGMCNVGYNPTFTEEKLLKVEVNILDFQSSIYDERVEVEWCFHIRSEKKFNGIEALIEQLKLDQETTKQYFAKAKNTLAFSLKT